ncbi:MAG: hypothetical protein RL154_1041, partial [Pseudomonadota bacterium]
MKKIAISLLAVGVSAALACTNILVTNGTYTSVGRTMDFAINMGNKMGFGGVGINNLSNVNLYQSSEAKPLVWTSKYAYIGQTGFQTYVIVDGINTAGVYAGFLYLPGSTKYPEFNPKDTRDELGVLDTTNYILGSAATVEEAIDSLKQIQFVANAVPFNVGGGKIEYLSFPLHCVVRDKKGSSLIIEWIDGKTKTYYHAANSTKTIEMTNFENPVTHENFNASTLTNAPEYSWHISNLKQYDKLFNGNNDTKINGLYMNGSGFTGLPGDYTPPSRMARTYTMAKFMPKAQNQAESDSSAYSLLEPVITSIASAPDSTLWISVSNLKDSIYYWKPMISSNVKNGVIKVAPFAITSSRVIKFDLNQLKTALGVPRGFLNSTVNRLAPLSKEQTDKVNDFLQNAGTKGPLKANVAYEQNLAEFNK